MGRSLSFGIVVAVAFTAAGCGATRHHVVEGPPPLISGPLAKPFRSTLLLHVIGASAVRVCFHIQAGFAADRPSSTTCNHARLLTTLPASYPVQKNLLAVFPSSVWSVELPRAANPDLLAFVVTASRASSTATNSFTMSS